MSKGKRARCPRYVKNTSEFWRIAHSSVNATQSNDSTRLTQGYTIAELGVDRNGVESKVLQS